MHNKEQVPTSPISLWYNHLGMLSYTAVQPSRCPACLGQAICMHLQKHRIYKFSFSSLPTKTLDKGHAFVLAHTILQVPHIVHHTSSCAASGAGLSHATSVTGTGRSLSTIHALTCHKLIYLKWHQQPLSHDCHLHDNIKNWVLTLRGMAVI